MTRPSTANPHREKAIRVLIADDSSLARAILRQALRGAQDVQVVGVATNGEEAVKLAAELKPDVITMDIHMPKLNGIEATRQIMEAAPARVLVVSSSVDTHPRLVFHAMEAGAIDALQKPVARTMVRRDLTDEAFAQFRETLIRKIRAAASAAIHNVVPGQKVPASQTSEDERANLIVGIASSTGGPTTLCQLLEKLPENFEAAIVIVQHIDSTFLPGLAEWLALRTHKTVLVAHDQETLAQGAIRIAPPDLQTRVSRRAVVQAKPEGPIGGFQPSATALFESLADWGNRAAGVILTGMGRDGVDGLQKLRQAGGWTAAQDKASSVIYGMPRIAAETGAAQHVLSIDEIPKALEAWVEKQRSGEPLKA